MTSAGDLAAAESDYLTGDATIAEAAKRLAETEDSAVPVCDANGNLRGMVTDRDLVVGVSAAGKVSSETRLIDLIRGEVVTVSADDSVEHAAATMKQHKLRRLPVVDGDRFVGMLSRADLLDGEIG
jgi:CBS domain-containing protein